ncbi:hypothetical protein BLOT_004145 [Blomia tropicalis]|nr:hypothetical protein BLOT_004145 [Blomia tropicalis]
MHRSSIHHSIDRVCMYALKATLDLWQQQQQQRKNVWSIPVDCKLVPYVTFVYCVMSRTLSCQCQSTRVKCKVEKMFN